MKILTFVFAAALTFSVPVTIEAAQTQTGSTTAAGQQGQVVETTRNGKRIDEQAVPITFLGRERIDARMLGMPGDILSLFNDIPGVRTQVTSPVLGTTVVRVHGLPGRYTRLLFDGVHLFSDRPGGHALLRIPAMDLDHVEVLKGAAGAFYGSDSPAGSVNLISRKPGAESFREALFSQSGSGATDGAVWVSTPETGPSRTWSSTFLASVHRQEEKDADGDGWSEFAGYRRGVLRPRLTWDNHKGKVISGVADVTFEKREGGAAFAREFLETKTASGYMSGQIIRKNGTVVRGAGALFIQSRTRDFPDVRERDRLQTATIEITMSRETAKHKWIGGLVSDWYGLRSIDNLPSTYISTRPGIFFHDDFIAAPWLVLSGSARVDHHNLYRILVSPRGSALIRGGQWSARLSAGRGYFTPRMLTEETEAAGLSRLKIAGALDVESANDVSAGLSHKTANSAVTVSVFHARVNNPALVDRATYTLRQRSEPLTTRGIELSGTARAAMFSVTGSYTFTEARERPGIALARTPRHSAGVVAVVQSERRGKVGFEVAYTGAQRLDANPYRTRSEAYSQVNLLAEIRFGRARAFVNGDNLTNVHQTHWDPIARPSRDVDGRWTVDAWAPTRGRVVNAGLRVFF